MIPIGLGEAFPPRVHHRRMQAPAKWLQMGTMARDKIADSVLNGKGDDGKDGIVDGTDRGQILFEGGESKDTKY